MRATVAAPALAAALALLLLSTQAAAQEGSADCAACPTRFSPVCCTLPDNSTRTVGSFCACSSCLAGSVLTFDGPCPPVGPPPPCPSASGAPVCCQDAKNAVATKASACECEGGGGAVLSRAACPAQNVCATVQCKGGVSSCVDRAGGRAECAPFICDCFDFGPGGPGEVCCETDGARETSPSPCACSGCGSGAELFKGKCPARAPCPVPLDVKPVCCRRPNGSLFEAVNEGACQCEDGAVVGEGACTEDGPRCFGKACADGEVCIIQDAAAVCVKPGETCATLLCGASQVCQEGDSGPKCGPPTTCACKMEFNPVCCDLPGGKRETRGNACGCTLCGAGGKIISNGECPGTPPPATCASTTCQVGSTCVDTPTGAECVPPVDCACDGGRPVCCDLGGGKREKKGSACECTLCGAGGKVVSNRKCRTTTSAPPAGGGY
jgi:hypothetical protein